MQNIIVKAHTPSAGSASCSDPHLGGPLGQPEPSPAQRQRSWRLGLLRAFCYFSTIAPVPFVLPGPADPEDSR
jgi:hypothetical protein